MSDESVPRRYLLGISSIPPVDEEDEAESEPEDER